MAEAVRERRNIIRATHVELLEAPGINPYKQVELYKNYRSLVREDVQDVICPKPSKEIFAVVEKEKAMNKDKKQAKKEMLVVVKNKLCNL